MSAVTAVHQMVLQTGDLYSQFSLHKLAVACRCVPLVDVF